MARAKYSFLFLAAALALVIVMGFIGRMTPLRSIFSAGDWGADFLKVILVIPGPPVAPGPFDRLVTYYLANPGYGSDHSVLHLPPLSMLISLLLRHLFAWISPAIVYLACVGAFFAAMTLTLRHHTANLWWAVAALVSYPALVIIDRGNLYAGLSGLCVVTALLRKKPDWIGVILFAVAINVRPNAVLFAIPLALMAWRFFPRLIIVGVAMFAASLLAANAIYHDYGLISFIGGVARYAHVYAYYGDGVGSSSSLYSALFALGYPHAYLTATMVAMAPLIFVRRNIDYGDLTFLCAACGAAATTIFGDYHLIIFLAPLILARSRVAFLASLLLLAPKGYWPLGDYNAQVVINPAIMIGSAFYVSITNWWGAIEWSPTSDRDHHDKGIEAA